MHAAPILFLGSTRQEQEREIFVSTEENSIKSRLKGGIITTILISLGFLLANIVLVAIGASTIDKVLKQALLNAGLFDEAGAKYFLMYFQFIYGWIAVVLLLFIFKRGRKYLTAFGTRPSGNRPSYLVAGLAIGLATNGFCIGAAVLCGNIKGFEFVGFQPLQVVMFAVAVFIQCSLEEIESRGFIFQRVKHCYGPMVAMIVNAVYFSLSHLLNGGINPLALLSIFVIGMLFSLVTYHFDSLWMAYGIHTGWNFCQGVLFGLPNSGIATGYAIFRPVGELTSGFAYDVSFGVESTIVAVVLNAVIAILIYLWGKKHPRPCYDVFES